MLKSSYAEQPKNPEPAFPSLWGMYDHEDDLIAVLMRAETGAAVVWVDGPHSPFPLGHIISYNATYNTDKSPAFSYHYKPFTGSVTLTDVNL